jgi:catechol 2,3-dioxygenase-like lactoylglutathione lyase family enzyme
MLLGIQGALFNVTDLDRSIKFYREVFGLAVVSSDAQVAALIVNDEDRSQVLLLREVRSLTAPIRTGTNSPGLRVLGFEAASLDELRIIEKRLTERNAFVGRRRTEGWTAIVGVDPDRTQIWVALGLHGGPIGAGEWAHLDKIIYEVD